MEVLSCALHHLACTVHTVISYSSTPSKFFPQGLKLLLQEDPFQSLFSLGGFG